MKIELSQVWQKLDAGDAPGAEELKLLLNLSAKPDIQQFFKKAYSIKEHSVGRKVYLRGLIDVSNFCRKDCFYCGMRGDSRKIRRFLLSPEEIIRAARTAFKLNCGSVVLQSGEYDDAKFVALITDMIKEIKNLSAGRLGIALALGEQSRKTYEKWFEAGARRYLLRTEAGSQKLYRKLHSGEHSFEKNLESLKILREIGYLTGTGIVIGLPSQTVNDLVKDLLFMRKMNIGMIGMGPCIVHRDTMSDDAAGVKYNPERHLELSLKMIAAARCLMKDVNIAASSSLQTLSPTGREQGLLAGANVIMPNVSGAEYRPEPQKKENQKTAFDENAVNVRLKLEKSLSAIGETIAYGEWNDPKYHVSGVTP